MSERKLREYGIACSDKIKAESKDKEVELSRVARGYTYTMRDKSFPPTRLAFDDNPFSDDILAAKNILDFGCGVGRNLPWVSETT